MVVSASYHSIWKAETLGHELKANMKSIVRSSSVHSKQRKLSQNLKINLSKNIKVRPRRIQVQNSKIINIPK